LIILIILGEEYKLWSSSLCSFLQSPVTSSLFGPNSLLNTLFSNTLSLCSSLNVRDQVSHPRNMVKKIKLLIKIIPLVSEGLGWWCITQGISGFVDFIYRPVFEGTRRFGNCICFRPPAELSWPQVFKQFCKLESSCPVIEISSFYGAQLSRCLLPPPFFTWGRKQIQFSKRRVPSSTGRWIKSRNSEIP
jgi:hypothetical protein